MSNDGRRQITGLLDMVANIGLRLGAVATGLALAYLLYVIFGPKLAGIKNLNAEEKYALLQSIGWARTMLRYGSIAFVLGLCIRFFQEETIGLVLTLVGAGLYFLSPSGFSSLTLGSLKQSEHYLGIVNDIATVGLICLVPGVLLLVRDVIMRIIKRFTAPIEPPKSESESEITRKVHKPKPYEMCWDMAVCNERSRRFCQPWKKRKPCWQLKSGCLCDQDVIRQALMERDRAMGGDPNAGPKVADNRPKVVLSAKQKRERCKSCTIWIEHQRQKFRIVTPIGLVAVGAAFAYFYRQLYDVLYKLLGNMDRFMSFLTYRQEGTDASFAAQGHTVTTLAMICIGVVLLSFAFRAIEYMIFELEI
ncbi:MAG: hypothetical protein GX139_08310 [Armatimonadetes bacterium]|nr:hypothetical protein [Armatimonadota bacterium]